jgi:superfamily II DNA or RNA helicase
LNLRDYQVDGNDMLRDGFRKGARKLILAAATSYGKCLGKGTPVIMFDGTVKAVEDVIVGDQLMGPDSKPRNVLSTCNGQETLYRIEPYVGEPYVVNESHILSLKPTGTKPVGRHQPGSIVNISVRDYLAENKTFKHVMKGWRVGVNFEKQNEPLPLDPYFLGLWLGDGHSYHSAVTTGDIELELYCIEFFAMHGLRVDCRKNSDLSYIVTGKAKPGDVNAVYRNLRNIGVLENKHIPHIYKTASRRSRLELLAGLLDSDGYRNQQNYFYICFKDEQLFDDFCFLARSLGFSVSKKKIKKTCVNNGKVGDYFAGSVGGNFKQIPFKRRCHQVEYPARQRNHLLSGFQIQKLGIGDYFGFTIDGDRLFMLGDFTVTHNTESALDIIQASQRKGAKCWFVVDRNVLINQTSERFDRYGIDHGIIQADHERTDYSKPVQIVSAQTLARRSIADLPDLIIVDECHAQYASVLKLMDEAQHARVIGLSATPFTAGMAQHWDGVINPITVNRLLERNYLTPIKIKACVSPDMTDAKKKFNGEYEEEEAGIRGAQIIGNVVQTWVEQTDVHFGGPVKTIVFSPSVKHGEELCRQFAEAGYNFQQISYLDASDKVRDEKIAEFKKADSAIHGLVSCAVLTKGFSVDDVKVGISCRPYVKSFSSHIQEMGRVMRLHPEKEYALWLCHSGNCIRFADDTAWLYEYGVESLSEAQKKDSEPREPTEKKKREHFCQECGYQMPPKSDACPSCGWERPKLSEIEFVEGELIDLEISTRAAFQPRQGLRAECLKDPKSIWNAALAYCQAHSRGGPDKARKWAFGVWKGVYPGAKMPHGLYDAPCKPGDVAPDEYSLVEREIKRYRQRSKQVAA